MPEELNLDVASIETFSEFSIDQLKGRYIEVGKLAKEIGYKN